MTLFGGIPRRRSRVQLRTKAAMLIPQPGQTDSWANASLRLPVGRCWTPSPSRPRRVRSARTSTGPGPCHRSNGHPDLRAVRGGPRPASDCPDAHRRGHSLAECSDPLRNTHRDPRGWAHSAVRTILRNEAYTGRRVWAKQEKVERLIDPDDVAAGNQTRFKWRPEDQWVRTDERIHPALVSDELFTTVQGLMASPERSKRKARASSHLYALRGVLYCAHCGRLMQGAWRANRQDGSQGRTLYRCAIRATRSLPKQLTDHPRSLYVREDAIWPRLTRGSRLSSRPKPGRRDKKPLPTIEPLFSEPG